MVNNFLNDDDFSRDKNKYERSSENQDKIVGVEIRQQNKQGDKFLIIADTLEETESKEKKIILENSLTTIDQKGILTKVFAGKAVINNNYNNFFFSDKVKITKITRKFTLKTKTLSGSLNLPFPLYRVLQVFCLISYSQIL